MTPETGLYLAKARETLNDADAMLGIGLRNAAGRTAYLAAFHAAQAYISERTNRSAKTHNGVHTLFQDLTRNDPSLPADLLRNRP